MANRIKFKVDTRQFMATLRTYTEHTRRDIPTICNTKAFYIARRATIETPKADKAKVLEELRGSRIKNTVTKKGITKQTKYTLAQLIIIARRAQKGLSTKKVDIKDDVKAFIAGRLKSIAFLKAGWIPSIKRLEPLAAKIGAQPPRSSKGNSGIQYGSAKGNATPASSTKAIATITNDALPKDRSSSVFSRIIHHLNPSNRSQALKYAEPGLQKAIDAEEASMRQHVEDKLRDSAKRAGIKTN